MSGLISPIETETQEFGLQLGNSSEFPAVYIDFQSSGLNIQLLLSHCIFKLFLPLKLSILGGRIRSIRQSLSESIGRAGSSRRPVRSAAPAVRPLRSGCVVVHSWPRPAPGRWTSRPDVPVVPRRPPLRRAGPAGVARREATQEVKKSTASRLCEAVSADAKLGREGQLPRESHVSSFPVSHILPLER